MDLQNLTDNYQKLINHMIENEYSTKYINSIICEIKKIIKLAPIKKWDSYKKIYFDYEQLPRSHSFYHNKRTILGIIEKFDIFGIYPGEKSNKSFIPFKAYDKLYIEFKKIVDYYQHIAEKSNKKESTINNNITSISRFFLHLQQNGCNNLDMVNEKSTLSFFISADDKVIKSNSYKKSIVTVLKICISKFPKLKKVIIFIPKIKQSRKNIQYLTNTEAEIFRNTLNNFNNELSFFDRAIGCLIYHTGLRRCDIANIKLDGINWDNDTINLIQQKTGVPLTLPLRPIVGNAIYDYITNERKQGGCQYLFISVNDSHKGIKPVDVGKVISQIMDVAQIRQQKGDRRGTHLFRHHVATKLIGNSVKQPIVSAVLGQYSPSSLDTYLSADFIHLKECALSVDDFPILMEVFTNESDK